MTPPSSPSPQRATIPTRDSPPSGPSARWPTASRRCRSATHASRAGAGRRSPTCCRSAARRFTRSTPATDAGATDSSEETPMQSRFDTEARIAVAQAADIARELGHSEVGPDHLLLGLLANARGTAYAALTDHGLRLDAAREIVATQHVDPVDEPDTADSDGDADVAPTSYDEDREALRAIGIDLDRVRDAVRTNLGQDLSDGRASRPERGRRGGQGRGRRSREAWTEGDERGEGRRGRGR